MTIEEAVSNITKALTEIDQYIDNADVMRVTEDALDLRDAFIMAIDALEVIEKYKPHNLRENPSDLPQDLAIVVCYKKTGNFVRPEIRSGWSVSHDNDAIAWQYLIPLEE